MVRLSVLLLVFCVGCAGEPPRDRSAPAELQAEEISAALELYQNQACNACHGEQAEGQEGGGPALRDLAPYWNVERLMSYLASPESFREANPDFDDRRDETYELQMPAFDYLSEQERRLLARWLMSL